ncbi:DUF2069 domain-containing protein [Castellaniella denitrificans]|uniref:DUF2069 domain-containing protein n=1 Tax=Castellaniella denitrificans TaxID=56119 RepID=A0ABT4M6K7_9BURK|nr:DUF2069 domain-containing protein [Castellaniella denitrificans]MCZ4330949.1 DUF2069 domain-containing protein [Castellaniella denitrificans]
MEIKFNTGLHGLACVCLFGLIALCVGWELWWAPLRPGGTLMALKAVPLLFAVSGVLRRRLYTLQWVSMLSLLYLMEGAVRAWSDVSPVSAALAGLEILLSLGLYLGAILYVRPAKRAARHG